MHEKPEVSHGRCRAQGLLPLYIHPESGQATTQMVSLGAMGDSYYEYLLKVCSSAACIGRNFLSSDQLCFSREKSVHITRGVSPLRPHSMTVIKVAKCPATVSNQHVREGFASNLQKSQRFGWQTRWLDGV